MEALQNQELLGALIAWHRTRDAKQTLLREETRLKMVVDSFLAAEELDFGSYQCGRYIITVKQTTDQHRDYDVKGRRVVSVAVGKSNGTDSSNTAKSE